MRRVRIVVQRDGADIATSGDADERTSIKRCERDLLGKSRSFLSPATVTPTAAASDSPLRSDHVTTARRTSHRQILTGLVRTSTDAAAKSARARSTRRRHQIFPGRARRCGDKTGPATGHDRPCQAMQL